MRLPKRYLIRVVKKRLIEFILMYSVINIVLLGVYMAGAKSGTGILWKSGDNWYISPGISHVNMILIGNPDLFPHVLIPENVGAEVHYIHFYGPISPYMSTFYLVSIFSLDLVPVFKIKQFNFYILFIFIAISSVVVFTYLYLNRKKFPLTNKLLG